MGGIWVRLEAVGLGLKGLPEALRLQGASGGCFHSASGRAGRKGVGWAEETLGSPSRRGSGVAPDHCVQWAGLLCGKGRPRGSPPPSLTSGGLAGRSWEEQLWSGLSLVTGLRGWGQPSPQGCGVERLRAGAESGASSSPSISGTLGLTRKLEEWLKSSGSPFPPGQRFPVPPSLPWRLDPFSVAPRS